MHERLKFVVVKKLVVGFLVQRAYPPHPALLGYTPADDDDHTSRDALHLLNSHHLMRAAAHHHLGSLTPVLPYSTAECSLVKGVRQGTPLSAAYLESVPHMQDPPLPPPWPFLQQTSGDL